MKNEMTLQECKDQVAFKHFSVPYNKLLVLGSQINVLHEAAELYASQFKVKEDKLQKFKDYVHDRLDKMGIPSDPEPENNAAHGCRIEGRLNVVEKLLKPE